MGLQGIGSVAPVPSPLQKSLKLAFATTVVFLNSFFFLHMLPNHVTEKVQDFETIKQCQVRRSALWKDVWVVAC